METKQRVCCQVNTKNCRFWKPFKVNKCTYWRGTTVGISDCLYCESDPLTEIPEELSMVSFWLGAAAGVLAGGFVALALMLIVMML